MFENYVPATICDIECEADAMWDERIKFPDADNDYETGLVDGAAALTDRLFSGGYVILRPVDTSEGGAA